MSAVDDKDWTQMSAGALRQLIKGLMDEKGTLEAERDAIMCASNNHAARVQETEAKLAELVREVRAYIDAYRDVDHWSLKQVLDKYEAKR